MVKRFLEINDHVFLPEYRTVSWYRAVSECSWAVIVTASGKEGEGAKVTLLQALFYPSAT
jgi:hypothetical protein